MKLKTMVVSQTSSVAGKIHKVNITWTPSEVKNRVMDVRRYEGEGGGCEGEWEGGGGGWGGGGRQHSQP